MTALYLIVTCFLENDSFVIIIDLIAAGTETTSTALRWFLAYMINYPDVQERCYREIVQVQRGGLVSWTVKILHTQFPNSFPGHVFLGGPIWSKSVVVQVLTSSLGVTAGTNNDQVYGTWESLPLWWKRRYSIASPFGDVIAVFNWISLCPWSNTCGNSCSVTRVSFMICTFVVIVMLYVIIIICSASVPNAKWPWMTRLRWYTLKLLSRNCSESPT